MARATLCVHCGKAIEHPDDPQRIKEIHKIMLKHELFCKKNPLVAKNKKLENYLEQINNLMWSSYHLKNRQFGDAQGKMIAEILNNWASEDL